MNLGEIRAEVMSIIGMSGTDEEERVNAWVNEGTTQVVARTGCEVKSAEVDLDVDEGDYESDPDIIATLEVYNLTDSCTLERINVSELLERRVRGSTGYIRYYASKADTFFFHPTPSQATQLKVYYVPQPRVLTDDEDEPEEVPVEWHYLITFWAAWRAADWDDDSSSQQGERYRSLFDGGIREMKRAMSHKAGHRLAPRKVNVRSRYRVSGDPSQTQPY